MKAKIYNLIVRSRWLLQTFEFTTNLNARKFAFLCRSLRCFTPKKCLNILRVELSYRLRRSHNVGFPYMLVVDPTNVCNLHCPLCPTGLGKSGRRKGMMVLETFRAAIDQLSEYAVEVIIYNWGEPLLNNRIYDMIRYASEQNIVTHLSTNLTMLTKASAEQLITSGLDHLRVSIDGVSQETYSQFRMGGSYHQVVSNLQLLIQIRDKLKSRLPLIDWYFLVMKHNEHEIPEAIEIARRLGVDYTHFVKIIPVDTFHHAELSFLKDKSDPLAVQWLPANEAFKHDQSKPYLHSAHCPWLWRYAVINYDGSVAPCCYVDNKDTDLGNILESNFREIWSNEAFRASRELSRKASAAKEHEKLVCYHCNYYKHSTSVDGSERIGGDISWTL
ncbi:radical SAM/SPASM domain-containing protein [Candidatus Poribacteria bacterium]